MMILFAQSKETRWIAILLSSDGNPRVKQADPESVVTETTTG
jgi:hypothetical protein